MCTVLFQWRWRADVPLVLVANRDELLSRPTDPPLQLHHDPPLWGGRDQLAGGTWLAVDPTGRVAAVTNRHPGGQPPDRDTSRRSRGDLPIALLAPGGDDGAQATMDSLAASDYNPVNVLYLSATSATWMALDDQSGRRAGTLTPGTHVLTEQDPDDPNSPKAVRLLQSAQRISSQAQDVNEIVGGFTDLLRSHDRAGDGPETAACIHSDRHGTVSSAIVVVTTSGVHYEHAEGHPCVTPYQPILVEGQDSTR